MVMKLIITVMKQCEGKGMEVYITCGHVDNTELAIESRYATWFVRQHMRIQCPGVGPGNDYSFIRLFSSTGLDSPQHKYMCKENEMILLLWNKKPMGLLQFIQQDHI